MKTHKNGRPRTLKNAARLNLLMDLRWKEKASKLAFNKGLSLSQYISVLIQKEAEMVK